MAARNIGSLVLVWEGVPDELGEASESNFMPIGQTERRQISTREFVNATATCVWIRPFSPFIRQFRWSTTWHE